MSRDPYPMLEQVQKIHLSKDTLGVDLDDPKVWSRPEVTDPDYYLTVHWGGGPNQAGWPIEEPGLTLGQKIAFQLGRCKNVVRGWLRYHISRGQSTIAYSTGVDSLFGMLFRFRGHRWNGGQWGSINGITHALVLVMGFGQRVFRRAWQTIGMVWFCGGGPRTVGHRFFNDWPETQTTTSCPGDEISALIAAEHYITALGRLRHRKVGSSRGRLVRAVTVKLTELAFLGGMKSRYTVEVEGAVEAFQQRYFVTGDKPGVVGFNTWKALAEA